MTTLIKISTAAAVAGAGLALPPIRDPQPKHYDPRPFRMLTKEEIDRRLRSGQFVTQSNQFPWVKAIYTNRMPSNNPTEDNFSVNTIQDDKVFVGVYDGHVGPACSEMIKTQLPIYVGRQLAQKESGSKPKEEVISMAFETLDADIQNRFYDLFPKNVIRATEQDIRDAIARNPAAKTIIEEAITGSCACTVYIDNDNVYAANAGDSRVIVIRQDEDGKWSGRALVEEQSPSRPEWREFLISQHPADEADAVVKRKRIFGLIAVGGCFGDIMYKVPKEYQLNVLPFIPYETYRRFAHYHNRIIMNYKTPPYLRSKPLVCHHKLTPGDRYVVLATDGLWDEIGWDKGHTAEGDQIAADLMSTWSTSGEDANAATHLMRQALLHDLVYKNIGIKEPVEDPVLEMSKKLTREPSRRHRDDITVTVIELDPKVKEVRQDAGPVVEPEPVDLSQPRLAPPRPSGWFAGWFGSKL
ncbi:phosphatase 2C-like domain-containing protein [Dichotomocladium elegans]|nr:phosphatase 2C-like domain-containing protein [Dichotomocladium elegans]